MRCRNMVGNTVVWFGMIDKNVSAGVPNYAEKEDAVVVSLKQHLSVLKRELWYQINYGLPITDKYTSKAVYDNTILEIITANTDVNCVKSYTSDIKNNTYTFNCTIQTIYNIDLNLSNSYAI